MAQDWSGTLKIALVALASSVAIALIVGFYENARAGKRAFWFALTISALVGTLQLVPAEHAPWILLLFAIFCAAGWWYWKRTR